MIPASLPPAAPPPRRLADVPLDLGTAADLLDRVGSREGLAELWEVPAPSRNPKLHLSPAGTLVETGLSSTLRVLSTDGETLGEVDLGAGTGSPWPAFRPDGSFAVVRGGAVRSCDARGETQWDVVLEDCLNCRLAVGPEGNTYVYGKSRLYALDPRGNPLWSRPAEPRGTQDTPVVAPDGTLYLRAPDGILEARSPAGEERWTWRVPGSRRQGDFPVFACLPAVGPDGTVYFSAWDRRLHAVGPDGQERWSRDLGGDPLNYQTPEIDGRGNVYVRGAHDECLSFAPDGTERWRRPYDLLTHLSASPEAGVAAFGTGHGIDVLDADGRLVFHYASEEYLTQPEFAPDGTLYTSGGGTDRALADLGRVAARMVEEREEAGDITRDGAVVRIGDIDLPVRGA